MFEVTFLCLLQTRCPVYTFYTCHPLTPHTTTCHTLTLHYHSHYHTISGHAHTFPSNRSQSGKHNIQSGGRGWDCGCEIKEKKAFCSRNGEEKTLIKEYDDVITCLQGNVQPRGAGRKAGCEEREEENGIRKKSKGDHTPSATVGKNFKPFDYEGSQFTDYIKGE